MKHFSVYSTLTGAVLRSGYCGDGCVSAQAHGGEGVIEAASHVPPGTAYVEDGEVVANGAMSPVVSGLTVSGLPDHCTARTEGQEFDVTGGEITFEYELPGAYAVVFSAWYFNDATVEVVQP